MRGKIILVLILVVSTILSGCGFFEKIDVSLDSDNQETINTEPIKTEPFNKEPSRKEPVSNNSTEPDKTEPVNTQPAKNKETEKENKGVVSLEKEKNESLVSANKEFSWDIFKKLNTEDSEKDIFISPFSISSMLTMALNGAEGTTKEALLTGLRYNGITIEELNKGYAYLMDRIISLDEKVELEIANSIWIRDGFEVKQNFIDTNRNFLGADVDTLDFSDTNAAGKINNWIADKTNNLITKMIDPPISRDVMMYLINAIYFKGEWTEAFKTMNTIEADFHAYDEKIDKVSMMQRSGKIEYYKNEDYQAVRLPYGNEKTGMVVILPNGDINEFIKDINDEKWNELISQLKPVADLNLKLPKFKMEYGVKGLNDTLSALGMGEAFSDSADFSGIAKDLFISRVLHKAVVDVNEEGTEAAAVTVGEFATTSFREPVSFIADRPFIFVIADNEDGNILFMGKKLYGDR
ncbi:MAG: serpin family protein [Ruminiclostridium sp.]|nr:serpin family protein [Ruminiclostridium sp.]